MKKAKRQYDNSFPSVTQVLADLRKIGLEFWFKKNTLAFIQTESERGKLIGKQIHEGIESHIELNEVNVQTEYANEVMNALKGFMQFKKDHPEIKLYKSEMMLTSNVHGYNGTLDALGEIGNVPIIFDWKTGQAKEKDKPDIYDEYIYQVSAYVKAYNEVTGNIVNRAFILVLAKDKIAYNLREVSKDEIDVSFKEVFLSALKIYNYQRNGGK